MAKPLFKVLGGLEETSLDTTIAVKRHMKGFVAAGKPLMQGRSNPIEVISLTEVGRLRKNDTTEIVIQKTEFRGSVGIDIREYVTSDRYTGWSKTASESLWRSGWTSRRYWTRWKRRPKQTIRIWTKKAHERLKRLRSRMDRAKS
jgi:hypothetical protein